MAFHETPRFLERVAYGCMGGPAFSTDVVTVDSGREKRNARWPYPQHGWDVSHGIRGEADIQWLRAFFLAKQGKAHGFRFKDFADFQCTAAQGVVVGLTGTTFELWKRYSDGTQTLDRPICKPLASGFVLRDSGTPLVLTTDYTLNATTGIVTTAITRTAGNLTWSGEFDVPMRFDVDKFEGRIVSRNAQGFIYSWDQIPVVELHPGEFR